MSVSVKGVMIDDMKASLARKKQEMDQRGKLVPKPKSNTIGERHVRQPDKNQTSKPKNPKDTEVRLSKIGKIGKNRGPDEGRGAR